MELALPYLESLDYVERYAWFEPNSDVADYYSESNYIEVGLVYKNHVSTPSIPEDVYTSSSNLNVIEVMTSIGNAIYDNTSITKVYTNPVDDVLNIEFQNKKHMNKIFEVFGLSGEVVLVSIGKSNINVSSLYPGIYFFYVQVLMWLGLLRNN